MRQYRVQEIPNLKDLTFTAAKKIARELCPHKTDQELAEETGIKRSTLASMLSRPDYHPALPNVPGICEALGNDILIAWPVAQRGGYVVFPPSAHSKTSLQHYIADITKEFSDLLEQDARAKMKDSPGGESYTAQERAAILRELNSLEERIESAKLILAEPKKKA